MANTASSPWQTARWHEELVPVPNASRKLNLIIAGRSRQAGQPLVIICAGLGGVAAEHILVAQLISSFARVLRFDRAGYGKSTRDPQDSPPESYLMSSCVQDLIAVLKVVDLPGPYILVGQSFGGIFIREFLNQRGSEAVKGMVFVDANPYLQRKNMSDVDDLIGDLCEGGGGWEDVNGLTGNCILSPAQIEETKADEDTAMKNGTIIGEADLADRSVEETNSKMGMKCVKDEQGEVVGIEFPQKKLARGRMSVIIGGFPDDFARVVELAKREGRCGRETIEKAEWHLARARKVWVPFHEALRGLTEGESRCFQAEGTGQTHNMQVTRPDIVANEVKWVFEGLC